MATGDIRMGVDGTFRYTDEFGNVRAVQVWVQGEQFHVKDGYKHEAFTGENKGAEAVPVMREKE